MKDLTDIVSGAGLAGYAEIALVIFLVVFVAVTWRVVASNTAALEHTAHLPLEDDASDRGAPSTCAVPPVAPPTLGEAGDQHVDR